MKNIDLPNAAYHPSTDNFEPPNIDRKDTPHTVSSIEQLLRVAIALGGRNDAVPLAEKAIEFQKKHEKNNVFRSVVVDRDHIEESNDPWLQNELNSLADQQQEILDTEQQRYDNRMHWYDDQVLSQLQDKMDRATSMLRNDVQFKAKRVVDDSVDENYELDESHIVKKHQLAGMDIEKFGYSTPIDLTVCISPDSGSIYPFVPWCGTTVCTGPTKHENPISTLCKHEIAALIQYSEDNFAPAGPKVPERFKRLMSPEAYQIFIDNVSP